MAQENKENMPQKMSDLIFDEALKQKQVNNHGESELLTRSAFEESANGY